MAPNDAKKIPDWQRATSLPGAEDVTASPESPPEKLDVKVDEKMNEKESTHEASREEEDKSKDDIDDLKEHVFKFLNDPSIKDASRERKAAFLESKGLKKEEVDLLLSTQEVPVPSKATPPPPTLAPRDVPPVVTYPEFLVHSQKPPPLVTKTLILNTAYFTAGLYATLYALSKYMVNPMQDQLSEARHDFLTHSVDKLETFNEKLGGIVTKVPEGKVVKKEKGSGEVDEGEESDDSDPTELFHRDFGTQTTPALSRRPSVASSSSSAPQIPDPTLSQETTLKSIATSLRTLSSSSESTETDISNQLSPFITQLNEMAYTSSAYYKYSTAGSYNWAGNEGNTGKDDEIDRLVKDIKNLKGQFLGVKNFPRAGVR